METGNGTQSALKHYDTKDYKTAGVIATENLKKPSVQALIEGYAEKAAKNIQTLAENAENETVRLNANRDQLDRAGYKAIDRSMTVNMNIDKPNPMVEELAERLNAILKGTDKRGDGTEASALGAEAPAQE